MTTPKVRSARSPIGSIRIGSEWLLPGVLLVVVFVLILKESMPQPDRYTPPPSPLPEPIIEETTPEIPVINHEAGSLAGDCSVLHQPKQDGFRMSPRPKFREQATLKVDVSSCATYLNSTSMEEESRFFDLFQPFEISLRPQSMDHDAAIQVYCEKQYALLPDMAQFLPLDRPLSVLDAGTNTGLSAILFAQAIAFSGEVMAVDANPSILQMAKENTAFLGGLVTPVEAAVVSEAIMANGSTLQFSSYSDHSDWPFPDRNTYTVQPRTLRMLKEQSRAGRFDVVKLDIDGEELFVLPDPQSRDVLCEAFCFIVELHDQRDPGGAAALNDFVAAGCGDGREGFTYIVKTGANRLYCKHGAVASP